MSNPNSTPLAPPLIITTQPETITGHATTPGAPVLNLPEDEGSTGQHGGGFPSPSPSLTPTIDGSPSPDGYRTTKDLRDNNPTKESGKGSLGILTTPELKGGRRHQRAGSEVTWASATEEDDGGASPISGDGARRKLNYGANGDELSPAVTSNTTRNGGSFVDGEKGSSKGLMLDPGHSKEGSGGDEPVTTRKENLWGKVRRLMLFRTKEDQMSRDLAKEEAENEKEGGEGSKMAHIDPSKDMSDPTPFHFRPFKLASLLDPKNFEDLEQMGGIDGLIDGLGTDGSRGLSDDKLPDGAVVQDGGQERKPDKKGDGPQYKADFATRASIYGANTLPKGKSKTFLELCWVAFQDKMLILLTIAAVVSLALGIYQAVGTPPEIVKSPSCPEGCPIPHLDWVEGVAIFIAVFVIVTVSSLSDWRKEKQFQKLNEQREDRTVTALRNGKQVIINTKDIVVGDVLELAPGEVLPVDGIFLRGSDCKADEAAATGESDLIKKASYEECLAERKNLKEGERAKLDCFMISGSKIADGVGEYLVVAVGRNSFNGRLMMSLQGEAEATPLQIKLNWLADKIALVGGGAGATLFFALMIRFFVQLKQEPERTAAEKGTSFINILIISVTLIVVSVPEGLPLAVVLALSFATRRMMSENLLVRVLASCETMGNATVICTDKTGTLTKADMEVVAGSLGVHGKFVQRLEENPARNNAEEGKPRLDFALDMAELNNVIPPSLQELLNQAVAINSTAFEEKNAETGAINFIGSKTETALLKMAVKLGWPKSGDVRAAADVVRMIPFSSEQKCMACIIRLPDGRQRLLVKGASEIMAKACSSFVAVSPPGSDHPGEVENVKFDEETRDNIDRSIIFYANQSLRTIGICYKDFPADAPVKDLELAELAKDLNLLMVVAIEDPLREGVIEAIKKCQKACVRVVMVTGDNVLTARSIAKQCGILSPGGVIMEGPTFRALSHAERVEIIPYLQILARSSPEDKRILVETHKELGEIVAASGDGANDAAALKLANVGFSMGIAGTEVAKTASDIIIMDDSFASMVTACMWGRAVNDAVRKFLQFQLSVNMSAIIITFVSAVASTDETSVLTAVQLLWINLIMDTLAALALASTPPTPEILDRKPDRKSAPLLSAEMLKQIIIQGLYQAITCLVLHFAGHRILNQVAANEGEQVAFDSELSSLVFNVFVFCQIFNIINCRRIDRKLNVFSGLFSNIWFPVIFMIILGGQILISFVGGRAFSIVRINGRDWGISLVVGAISIPLGTLIRLLPTEPFSRFLIKIKVHSDPNALPTISQSAEDDVEYNEAFTKIKDNLNTFATIRGGRLRSSSMVLKSRSKQMEKHGIQPASFLAMVPTLIAGTVGAGAGWVAKTNQLGDPAGEDPSRSTHQLWQGKLTFFEPDVNSDLYKKYGDRDANKQ